MRWSPEPKLNRAALATLAVLALGSAYGCSSDKADQSRNAAGEGKPEAGAATMTMTEAVACVMPQRSSCQTARGFFSCHIDGGANLVALASNADSLKKNPAYHFTECHDECTPTEYGVQCGELAPVGTYPADAAPARTFEPPPGCRQVAGDSVSLGIYCCPCG